MSGSRATLPALSDRMRLGSTGLSVSAVCVGRVARPELVVAAFDAGVNFFFVSADLHWRYYEPTRVGLARLFRSRRVRDRVVVAAATYAARPEFAPTALHDLLEETPGLRRVDVAVVGGVATLDLDARVGAARRQLESGLAGARALGASFHEREAAVAAVNRAAVDIAWIRYNPIHPGARQDLLPRIERSEPRLFNFKNVYGLPSPSRWPRLGLSKQHWRPHPSDYYRFALTPPRMDGLLCALSSVRHLRELAAALERGALTDEEERYLIDLAALDRATPGR